MFSCAFVPLKQNTNQGANLNAQMYQKYRIIRPVTDSGRKIAGDSFWVWVLNAPDKIPTVKQCSQY